MEEEFRCQVQFHIHPFSPAPDASWFLAAASSNGGRVEVWCQHGPRLLIRVRPPKHSYYAFPTRELVFTSDEHFELSILCDEQKALAWINGAPAGSMLYPLPDDGPLEVRLPQWAESQVAERQRWCWEKSSEAVARRGRARQLLKSKPGRRLLSEREFLASLATEAVQIRDLMALINAGSSSHLNGLAARVRSVACYMKNRKALPLLQLCASLADLHLTVHTPAPHWASFEHEANVELGGRIFPSRTNETDLELDLDVWLFLPLFRFDIAHYPSNDVVRAFAETMGGAHHDTSVDPNIQEIQKHFGRSLGSQPILDLLSVLVVEVAATVLVLAERTLQTLQERESGRRMS